VNIKASRGCYIRDRQQPAALGVAVIEAGVFVVVGQHLSSMPQKLMFNSTRVHTSAGVGLLLVVIAFTGRHQGRSDMQASS
jgi:hypothetical protein